MLAKNAGMPHEGSLVHVDQQSRAMRWGCCTSRIDPLEVSQSLARMARPKIGALSTPKNGTLFLLA